MSDQNAWGRPGQDPDLSKGIGGDPSQGKYAVAGPGAPPDPGGHYERTHFPGDYSGITATDWHWVGPGQGPKAGDPGYEGGGQSERGQLEDQYDDDPRTQGGEGQLTEAFSKFTIWGRILSWAQKWQSR